MEEEAGGRGGKARTFIVGCVGVEVLAAQQGLVKFGGSSPSRRPYVHESYCHHSMLAVASLSLYRSLSLSLYSYSGSCYCSC